MHKKILRSVSVVLTAALLFSIITCAPFSIGAAETGSAESVATGGEGLFGSLNNGKYTLSSETYRLTEDFAAEGYIYVPSGKTAVIDLNGHTISRNLTEAASTGHVLSNNGTLKIKDSAGTGSITGGYAVKGGGVYNNGTLTIEGGNFVKNRASEEGGAVFNAKNATLTITGGVFRMNKAETYGGGAITNFGTMDMSGGTVLGNEAATNGGGVWTGNTGTLNLTGGTITTNLAQDKGSGVYSSADGTLNMSGSPRIIDNVMQNLYLEDNSVINITGAFTNNAAVDVSAKNMPRAVTSGFTGSTTAITFANGQTPSKLVNGEINADIGSPQMIDSWAALDSAVYNPTGTIDLALSGDIVNTNVSQRINIRSGRNVTIDLCGNTVDINRAGVSASSNGYFIAVNGSTVTIKDSYGGGSITGGNGKSGGVFAITNSGTLNLYNVTLTNNNVSDSGGAIHNQGNLYINGAVIDNCSAASVAGAVYVGDQSQSTVIIASRLSENTAVGKGGAIYHNSNKTNITTELIGCYLDGNKQTGSTDEYGGGAVFLKTGKISMTGGAMNGNEAYEAGALKISSGAIFSAENTAFNGNKALNVSGGAINNNGSLTLTGCTLNGNNAAGVGGGLYQYASGKTATVTDTDINGNTSAGRAGGVYVKAGTLSVSGGSISGNTSGENGGGIYSFESGAVSLTGCTLSNNVSPRFGGGIYILNGGATTFEGCKFTGNTAGTGGAVYISESTSLTLKDTTITGNRATSEAGGVYYKDYSSTNLYVSGEVKVTGNVIEKNGSDVPNNIYIAGSSKVLGISGTLSASSQIGLTASAYDRKVTSGLNAADENALAMFSLDEQNQYDTFDVSKTLSGKELYIKKVDKILVNSWSGLQSAINSGDYEKIITLSDNITASGSQTRIRIYDDDVITIDLNGKKLDRHRSSSDGDGHVIEVHDGGKLTIRDSSSTKSGEITGGFATRGGGINVNDGGTLIFESGSVKGNKAEDGGGIYVGDSATFVMQRDALVTNNTATDEGGGIDFENSATLNGGYITKNTAKYGGGVYYDEGGEQLTINNATLRENVSTYRGGGIYIWHGTVKLDTTTVSKNTAKDGGGVYVTDDCTLKAVNSSFVDNRSTNAGGGAIVNVSVTELTTCTFTGNAALKNGGAVWNDGTTTATSCTFRNNRSLEGYGGAICQYNGSFILDGGEITGNDGAKGGGAAFVDEESDNFKIQGDLNVIGNGKSNIYLDDGEIIKVTGPLTQNARIGVSLKTIHGTFTSGYSNWHSGEDPANYFVPEDSYSVIPNGKGEAMIIDSDWTVLRKQFENAGQYELIKLERDWSPIKEDSPLTVAEGKSITLDLNGHTIDGKNLIGTIITVNGTLLITDSSTLAHGVITGGSAPNGGAIVNNGTLTLEKGTLSGNKASNCGGAVLNKGTFNMTGGAINDNNASNGAALYNQSGTATITGGEMKGNSASTAGGAVYIEEGTVNLYGGTITENNAVKEGGGVVVSAGSTASLKVSRGPVVQNNSAAIGKNILLYPGKKINVTSVVNSGAYLDVVTKDTSKALTSGFGDSGSSSTVFYYNGSAADIKTENGELWLRKVTGDYSVNTWDDLQVAINSSSEDDVIVVNMDLSGYNKNRLKVNDKKVTIELNGHTIDRRLDDDEDEGEVFYVTGGGVLTIDDHSGTGVITGGNNDDDGGGINIAKNSTCIIKGGSVQGNYSDSDGGGVNVEGTLIMLGGSIAFNIADDNAGGVYCTDTGIVRLDGATVTGNRSESSGGGMLFELEKNESFIKNSVISNNFNRDDYGGGVFMRSDTGKTLTIENSRFEGNTAIDAGGGVFVESGNLKIKNSQFSKNQADMGGGLGLGYKLWSYGISVKELFSAEIEGTEFSYNRAIESNGGAILCFCDFSMTNCIVKHNTAEEDGGGLYFRSAKNLDESLGEYKTFTFKNTFVDENKTNDGRGAGMYVEEGTVDFEEGSISNNKSKDSGGGVFLNAKDIGLIARGTAIDGNRTDKNDSTVNGGGLCCELGGAKIYGGSISESFAKYSGGAAYVASDAKLYLEPLVETVDGVEVETPVRLDHNECDLYGGTIYVEDDGWLYLNGCEITNDDSLNSAVYCTEDIYIKGYVFMDNNKSGDIFILDEDDRVNLEGPLANGSKMGIKLRWETGEATSGYKANHGSTDPAAFFHADEEGYGVGLNNKGEVIIRSTRWIGMQRVIDNAQSGSTITLDRDYEADSHDSPLVFPANKPLTLDLNGHKLDGGGDIAVIQVANGGNLTIKDSAGDGMITGGKTALGGGGILNKGTLTIQSGSITGNYAGTGGGVLNSGTMTVSGGEITGNVSKGNGAGIANTGTLTVTGGEITYNSAYKSGGGVYNNGTFNLHGSRITENIAAVSGGGIMCAENSVLNAKNAPFVTGNTGSAGKNIQLGTGRFINLEAKLTTGAKLDLATQDITAKLTNGFETTETEKSVFSYNENSAVVLEKKNKELYYPKNALMPDVNVWVNNWSELQTEINNATEGKIIGLNADLGATGQRRIVVDGKKVTLELAGHIMDRHLTSESGTGSVIKVTGSSAVLTIRDTVETGVITGGYEESDGGGIYINGGATCKIQSGTVSGNRAKSDGGGVCVEDGKLEMSGGFITANTADDTAGGIYCYDDGTIVLDNATVRSNSAENDGGGLNIHLDDNQSKIENSFIGYNESRTADGGGIRMQAGGKTLNISNTRIEGNSAENLGGGIILDAGTIIIDGGTVAGNQSEDGGGVYVGENTDFTAKNAAAIEDNTATDDVGGGITCYGRLDLDGAYVRGNTSESFGGGIYYKNSGVNATFTDAVIENNEGKDDGGGIYLEAGTITMDGGKLSGNTSIDGGGIFVTDDTEFIGKNSLEISGNKATEEDGGGIVNKGDVMLTSVTVKDNTAKNNGGGVWTTDNMTLNGCTFKDNEAQAGYGGAVHIVDLHLYLTGNNTITDNSAVYGSGIYVDSGADIHIKDKPVITDNYGMNLFLDEDIKIYVYGKLDSGTSVSVSLARDYGTFTQGFANHNPDDECADFFASDYEYEVYKADGEAALRWAIEEDNGFISRDNNIKDYNKVTGQNWMSAISGERRINEINLIRAHDAAMNNVEGNGRTSGIVKWTGGIFGFGIIAVVALSLLAAATGGGIAVTAVVFSYLIGAIAIASGGIALYYRLKMGEFQAKTQYRYIDEQMRDGVRIFDLRINNKNQNKNDSDDIDDNVNLWHCHGESTSAGVFYGCDHDGKELSVNKTLEWAKEFLKSNPTEVLLFEYSLETFDNEGYEEVVYKRLQRILKEFSYEINPSTGKPYLYLEDGILGKYYTYWPQLKQVRGQLLITASGAGDEPGFDQLIGGYSWKMGGKYPTYSRANTGGGDTINTPRERIEAIENAVDNHPLPNILTDAMVHRNIDSGYYVNSTDDPYSIPNWTKGKKAWWTQAPTELATKILYGDDDYVDVRTAPWWYEARKGLHLVNAKTEPGYEGLLREGGNFNQHGRHFGIFSYDGITSRNAKVIWSSNFYDDLQYCTITVKTGVQGDQQKKTYKVLKGTTITIPGSIYDNPYNGQGYFQNWLAETGDTNNWTPDVSLQADLGRDETRTELKSNRDWLLAHTEIVEIDPSTQIEKNSSRVVQPGEQITIMDDTEFTAQWGVQAHSPIEVVWDDGNNAEGIRTDRLKINYKVNGDNNELVENSVYLDEVSEWKTIVNGLFTEEPTVDWEQLTGNENTGYRCVVTPKDAGTGYTLTLYHLPQTKVEANGKISWDDQNDLHSVRPESVTVCLMKDGTQIGTKTVTAADNWEYDFGVFNEYVKLSDGTYKRDSYTVVQKPVNYYQTIQNGFDFKNTFELPESDGILVTVKWSDGANSYGMRPNEIKLHLYDGNEEIKTETVTVDSDAIETYVLFDVDEYEKNNIGKEFNYHVEQDAIPNYSIKSGSYVSEENTICYTNKVDNSDKYFKAHSISLNGYIDVNFYLALTLEQAQNAKVSFKWFDKELNDVEITPSMRDSKTGYYKVSCPVSAAEMTYKVAATLTLNGAEVETNRFSVYDYANITLLDKEFLENYIEEKGEDGYQKFFDLLTAMLDYGGKAQERFDRNIGELANDGMDLVPEDVTEDMITTVPDDMSAGLADYGLEYQYSSVVFLSGNSLRHFYKVTDQAKFDAVKNSVKFVDREKSDQIKEYEAKPVERGDLVFFEMKNIPASKLDNQYELTIGGSAYKYSVLDGAKLLMAAKLDNKTTALCKAAYLYNKAADVYFGLNGAPASTLPDAVQGAGGYIRGDANTDGVVDIRDVTAIQRKLSEWQTTLFNEAADVDGNGLSISDATEIQAYLAEFESDKGIGNFINDSSHTVLDEYEAIANGGLSDATEE